MSMSIFSPIQIKSMTCPNRILRSATWEALSDKDGFMSQKQFDIYCELAENNIGLICTGYARISKDEYPNAGMMGIYDECFIPLYRKLTDIVHSFGSSIMMQIAYGGTKTTYETDNRVIFAPGNVPERSTGLVGTPMTISDIQEMIEKYASAAIIRLYSILPLVLAILMIVILVRYDLDKRYPQIMKELEERAAAHGGNEV